MEWADVEEALPPDVQQVVLGFVQQRVRKKHILLQLIRRRLEVFLSHHPGGHHATPRPCSGMPGWWGVMACVNCCSVPFRFISILRSEDGRDGRVYAWHTHRSFRSYLWRQRGDRPWVLAPSIHNSHL